MEIIELFRIVLNLLLILFIPGFLWSYVFFKKDLDAIERMVISFGLSTAMITLMILFLNRYLGIKVVFLNIFLAVIVLCAIATGILWKKKEHIIYGSESRKIKPSKSSVFLLLILFIAVYFSHIPHSSYDFPVHRDEWDHLSASKAIIKAENTLYPHSRLGPDYYSEKMGDLEIGFHLWISEILLAGTSEWLVFKYLNILVACFMVLCAYIFARPFGYGMHAAFFTSLIPTSVRLLGPGFLVPVSLAVAFMALSMFIIFREQGSRYISLFIIFLFLLYSHPPTALALFIVFTPYIVVFNDRKLVITILSASILAIPQFFVMFLNRGLDAMQFSSYTYFADLFKEYGYLPTIFFIIGSFFIHRRNEKDKMLVYGALILLILNLLYRNSGWSIFFPERNYFYLFSLMSIIAGYGMAKLKDKRLIAAMVLLIFFFSYNMHISTPYYRVIGNNEFVDFIWIKDNLEGKAVIEPWKGVAFPAVAEKYVYSFIPPGANKILDRRNREIYEFFRNHCSNTSFIAQNNITIVYSYVDCQNEKLEKLKDKIYYLRRDDNLAAN